MKSDNPPSVRLADYAPPRFLIDHVELSVRLDCRDTQATGVYYVRPNPSVDHGTAESTLRLDADGLGAVDVWLNDAPVDAQQDASSVSLNVPSDSPCRVKVRTKLDPATNTALSGLYLTNGVYCTQCEAEGFRRIVPFIDRPDVLATYSVSVEASKDDCPVLLSNGNPGAVEELGNGWHRVHWNDPHPKPCYLFALVGGKFDKITDRFVTKDEREVELAIYVEPGKADRADFAMDALKRSMVWDEERFGRLYDLDVFNIVAVSDFNLGAMENKGLNIFNDKYILASPETATDEDYERIDSIIAHEYFHNWSGNRVTCRDWFQLCLKEGLTVFRDQEYTSDVYDRSVKRIRSVRDLWAHQFPEDAGPLAHAVRPDTYREINNFYTATVYEKGAEIVRMIANWLEPERFRAAMDRYFSTYDGQAVRLEEFLACAEIEGADLGTWPDFMGWYTQAGTPHVDVVFEADPDERTASLTFSQSTAVTPGQKTKKPLPVPCKLALLDKYGHDIAFSPDQISTEGGRWVGEQFLLEDSTGAIHFSGLPDGLIRPSLYRDYSAPVTHDLEGLDESDRLFLAREDGNAFNSWAQLQALCSESLQRRYHRLGLGEPLGDDALLFETMLSKGLCCPINKTLFHAARAAATTLPSPQDLARTIARDIDPHRVELARKSFSTDLCRIHGERMLAMLEETGVEDDGDVSPAAASRRALILALLQHLANMDDPRAEALIARAYETSVGMTMRIKTLTLLIKRRSPAACDALASFEERFGDDPLAMDKWFAVQATNGNAQTVADLEHHASYDANNPNRVRSLIGSFSGLNLPGFHAADGSGYSLLADRIVEIDANNPQLAARLASSFRTWKTMDKGRQEHARAALATVKTEKNLSPDLCDIILRIRDA